MKPYEVIFTPGAEADFDSILHYIAAHNPIRAITFADELRQKAVRSLSFAPNAGTIVGRCRSMVFGRYVIVYSVDESEFKIRVLVVAEEHRNWRALFEDG